VTSADVQTAATVVLAVATVVLAGATILYWLAAKATVKEMREGRRPVLTLTPAILGVNFPVARLTNVGSAPALDIRGQINVRVGGAAQRGSPLVVHMLLPGDFHEFFLDLSDEDRISSAQQVVERGREFGVELTYRDASQTKYELAKVVSWREIVEVLWKARVRRVEGTEEQVINTLTKIADQLGKIEGNLRKS
jgi:hypothetical protein